MSQSQAPGRHRGRIAGAMAVALGACLIPAACGRSDAITPRPRSPAGFRTVTDMRGVRVQLPTLIERVATVDDGLVEEVMTRLGVIRTLVATGSDVFGRTYSWRLEGPSEGAGQAREGIHIMVALEPWVGQLPCAAGPASDAIAYETIAAASPDVVIVRAGDCTVARGSTGDTRAIERLEALGIPVVVLLAPTSATRRDRPLLADEINLLGWVFARETEAAALVNDLAWIEGLIRARTVDPGATPPQALLVGLSAQARKAGGAALTWGLDTPESVLLEQLAGARNAYRGIGFQVLLGAEQILALDPDVIFLPTQAGYHSPSELLHGEQFRLLAPLRAVRARRVYPLTWAPMNCAPRLEYLLDALIMAWGAHPSRFGDIDLGAWITSFYRQIYRADARVAATLRTTQWLEWTAMVGH